MQIECTVESFHADWLRPLEIMAEKEANTAKFLNMDDIMQAVRVLNKRINAIRHLLT